MNGELLALVLGTVLAVGALAYVLYPLFFQVVRRAPQKRAAADDAGDDSAIRALREIEFDRATGKLSDTDYAELRRDYGNRAVSEMRASSATDKAPAISAADPVEAMVAAVRRSHRQCKTCGVRPERDAVYCSTCGSYLDGRCGACGRDVIETAAGFCSHCGAGLGAAA